MNFFDSINKIIPKIKQANPIKYIEEKISLTSRKWNSPIGLILKFLNLRTSSWGEFK